jgi:hypothetical protein
MMDEEMQKIINHIASKNKELELEMSQNMDTQDYFLELFYGVTKYTIILKNENERLKVIQRI